MKYCTKCGQELKDEANFCDKCGTKISDEKSDLNSQKEITQKSKPKSNKLLLFIILGFILIFICYHLTSNNKDGTKITSSAHSTKTKNFKDIRYAHKRINLREGRGTKFKVIDHLDRGDKVEIDSLQNGWAIVYKNGIKKGFVFENLLKGEPIPPFEIVSWNWSTDPSFGTDGAVIWNVQVRNNTNKYVSNLKVELTTYDASGNIIESDFTYVSGLSPGGTSSAKAYATYFGREKKAGIRIDPSSIY